jgi:hypothetical protein
MPSASHVGGEDPGVIKHVRDASKPTPEVARPPAPVMVVNVAVAPGITALDSGVATGTAGVPTEVVSSAFAICPVESTTTYLTAGACPVNVSTGSNKTVPSEFTT